MFEAERSWWPIHGQGCRKHLCLDDCWVAWTTFFSVNKEELARTAGSLVQSGD